VCTDPLAQREPTAGDLAEIEREWPLIEAEMALLDAEIMCLSANGGASPMDWHRVRRAEARVTRELVKLRSRPERLAVRAA
jgi:hypothetical protein